MNTELAGKVVLITGASGGIGSAIARGFAAEGAKLVLHYRHGRSRALAVQRQLKGSDTLLARADLTSEAEVKRLFTEAISRFGRVDTLVANAGCWETRDVRLHKMPLPQCRRAL